MIRKNYKYILLFIFCFVIAFLYNFFLLNVNCDEIWNYGFSYNVLNGLIPYRDFNVVVTPIFFFIGSLFVWVFGSHIYAYDIYIAVIVGILMILCYIKFDKCSLILLFIIVPHLAPSYNALCFLLMMIILLIVDSSFRYEDFFIGLLIGLIFLSKQSIGIVLLFVMLLISKNRLKSCIGFIIPNLILTIYLVYYDALFDFIDYCFLGLLDFNNSNLNFSVAYMPIFIIVFIVMLIQLIKSDYRDIKLWYIIGFQSVAYPIFDANHVMLGVILYLIYLFDKYKDNIFKNYKYYLIISLSFFVIYCTLPKKNYHLYNDRSSFLNGKGIYDSQLQEISYYDSMLKKLKSFIIDNSNKFDNIFVFSLYRTDLAYISKLDLGISIGKYDLINNGNMGYNGDIKLINDIGSLCNSNNCIFFIDNRELYSYTQGNRNIYDYVINNYSKINSLNYKDIYFDIYK